MKKIIKFLYSYYLYLILFISFTGTAGSLVLSNVLNLTPCDLCWYQRIFMYSIFVISLIGAVIKDEKDTYKYIIGLAIPGAIIAIYNYFIQLFPSSAVFQCSVNNPCTKVDFQLFGFLTIPLMAFIAFVIIITLCGIKYKLRKNLTD